MPPRRERLKEPKNEQEVRAFLTMIRASKGELPQRYRDELATLSEDLQSTVLGRFEADRSTEAAYTLKCAELLGS
jgi:hypothetical protein